MRAVLVVAANVLDHETLEMPLVEHDDMIEQIVSATADKSFCYAVLPRTAKASSLGFYPEALDGAGDFRVEVSSVIEDQILRGGVIRKCLTEFL
jgi:hypothetical protein